MGGIELADLSPKPPDRAVTLDEAAAAAKHNRPVMRALLTLRESSEEGTHSVSKYLKQSGYPVRLGKWTAFTLNVIFHVFVLFFALTMLYIFVVGPQERSSLQKQFDNQVQAALKQGLVSGDAASGGALKTALKDATPALEVLAQTYSTPNQAVKEHNWGVFAVAFGVVAVLAITFAATVLFLRYGAGIPMATVVAHIGFENLILFAIIGIAEFLFFKLVASKYIPILPSTMLNTVLDNLQTEL